MANYARNHVCFLFSARVHYQPILLLGMGKLIGWALPPKVYELKTALPPCHSRATASYQDDPDALLLFFLSTQHDAHHHFAYGHAPPLV